MARLERDRPSIRPSDKFSGREILRSIRSPQVIILFIVLFMKGTGLNGMALFLPSIVNELGFGQNHAQLLSVGPFAVGFFGIYFSWTLQQNTALPLLFNLVTLIASYLSDRYQSRGVASVMTTLLAVAGYSIYLGE